MKPSIILMGYTMSDRQKAKHYVWGSNCDSWVLADTPGLSVKQENMPPGSKEQLHFHNKTQQFFFILTGTATFYLDGEKEIVKEQGGILITEKTEHYIANETQEGLNFLVISQPAVNTDRVNIAP